MEKHTITPTDCPKWDSCNAAVCPLNRTGKHLQDEAICLYARETVKTGSEERFKEFSLDWLHHAITENLEWLLKQSSDIRYRLYKASQTRTSLTQPAKGTTTIKKET